MSVVHATVRNFEQQKGSLPQSSLPTFSQKCRGRTSGREMTQLEDAILVVSEVKTTTIGHISETVNIPFKK